MSLIGVDNADRDATAMPSRVVQANLFGIAIEAVPSSPSDLGEDVKDLAMDVRELIANLRLNSKAHI